MTNPSKTKNSQPSPKLTSMNALDHEHLGALQNNKEKQCPGTDQQIGRKKNAEKNPRLNDQLTIPSS